MAGCQQKLALKLSMYPKEFAEQEQEFGLG